MYYTYIMYMLISFETALLKRYAVLQPSASVSSFWTLTEQRRCHCCCRAGRSSLLYQPMCVPYLDHISCLFWFIRLLIQFSDSDSFILQEWFCRGSSWQRGRGDMGTYILEIFLFKFGTFLSGRPHIHFGISLSGAITISSMWFNCPRMKGSIL